LPYDTYFCWFEEEDEEEEEEERIVFTLFGAAQTFDE
jgi:hypothetical protein